MADESRQQPKPAGADRTGNEFFARRGWLIAVFLGLTAIGAYLAGIVGILVMGVIGGVFLLIASR